MYTLDWHILKKLVTTFFFCLLLFTVVAVAVDSSEKADDFVKSNLTTAQLIQQYYLGFVPWIWSLLFPLFVFIAVIFFTSKMALQSEIIAILASGTSYRRFLRPYLVGGLLLASILWISYRFFIPKANALRSNFQANYIDKDDPTKNRSLAYCSNCFYLRTDTSEYIGIKYYDTATQTANTFFLERIKNNKIIYNLRGSPIKWDTAKNKWLLQNVFERTVHEKGESIAYRDSLFLNISLKPNELRKDAYVKDKLTTPELVAYIKQERIRGAEGLNILEVEQHRRNSTPASVLLLTLIGAVIASRKTRGGSGMHLAFGIIIAALFIISDRFSTVFATKSNLHPMLAAWLPNIVFGLVAYRLYRKTPK